MPQRHEVSSSGIKVDRHWWHATKPVAVIAVSAAAAFTVMAMLQ